MPNRELPVSRVQVVALNVEVGFTEAALVAEVVGVSPGPVDALDVATRVQAAPARRWSGPHSSRYPTVGHRPMKSLRGSVQISKVGGGWLAEDPSSGIRVVQGSLSRAQEEMRSLGAMQGIPPEDVGLRWDYLTFDHRHGTPSMSWAVNGRRWMPLRRITRFQPATSWRRCGGRTTSASATSPICSACRTSEFNSCSRMIPGYA